MTELTTMATKSYDRGRGEGEGEKALVSKIHTVTPEAGRCGEIEDIIERQREGGGRLQ
jgi:D-lyxose ketol-isomerase